MIGLGSDKKIPGNTLSYISTLLPDLNPTRYPVFCPLPDPTRPDIEKPYPLGTGGRGLPIYHNITLGTSNLYYVIKGRPFII